MGLLREAVRRVWGRDICGTVAIRSGWKMVGGFRGVQFFLKSCQVYSSVMSCMRGESGKETLWSQTLKNWSRRTRLNSTPGGSMWKEVSKFLEEIRIWEHPPWSGTTQTEEKNKIFFFSPTTILIRVWWWNQKWFLVYLRRFHFQSSCGNPSQTVRADWRIIPNSTAIHWRCHDVGCDVVETYWRLLECWWRKRPVGYMDRFHEIHFIEWEATWWIYMVREETDKKTYDFKTRQCVARKVETHVPCIETQREAKSGLSRNQSSIMPKDYVVFTSWILKMRNSRTSWKNARRKLEISMPAAMPCKTSLCRSSRETCRALEDTRRNTLVYLKLTNLWASEWKELLTDIMKITLQEKCTNSLSHYNLVHTFILMPHAVKNQMQRQQWKKNGKTRENAGMADDESQKQERRDRWSKEWGQKSSFCVIDGSLSSQEFGVGVAISEITKVELYSEVTLWKMIQDRTQCSRSMDHQHH